MDDRSSVLRPAIDDSLVMSDSDLFWQEHWKKFVAGLAAIVLGILGFGVWSLWTSHVRTAAESLYSTAAGPDGWREVIAKFPDSLAAGNARLALATELRSEGKAEDAEKELEQFVELQPDHPMAGAAWLTLGELRQLGGDNAGALEAYRTASADNKASYAAPLALLAEARLLVQAGSVGEARAVLESVGLSHPETPAAMVAAAELSRLQSQPASVPASSPAGN